MCVCGILELEDYKEEIHARCIAEEGERISLFR